jgi:threonine dehydrogenase-like Zn-dependent dehydrogenase
MKALVYDGQLKLVRRYPRPGPPPGEALVRVTLAGICNTDLEITKGYLGFQGVLGHEFVGIVEECEAAELVGKRVVGEINAACGECTCCRAGLPTHCTNRTVLGIVRRDGAFADYLTLPMRNLHVVPDSLPDEAAVFTEPLAAALEIMEQVHLKPTSHVAVLGDGKLGLLVAQVLSLTGCELTALGHHPEKLAILQERGLPALLADQAPGIKADVVVECTGRPEGLAMARQMVVPRGTIVLKSTFHGSADIALSPLVVDEVTIVGSRCGPFAPALRLLGRGLVAVEPLIAAIYPLSEGLAAFEHARTPGTLKVLLRIA